LADELLDVVLEDELEELLLLDEELLDEGLAFDGVSLVLLDEDSLVRLLEEAVDLKVLGEQLTKITKLNAMSTNDTIFFMNGICG
jgi:hypothetical protein